MDRCKCTNVTVYFEGTANSIDHIHPVTQIGLFASITKGIDLNTIRRDQYESFPGPFKLSFDGCGVSNGMRGLLFADGLLSQCQQVQRHVRTLMECGHSKIVLTAVGLSRGGIAVLFLAQLLGDINRELLQLNLLLFDPVPGNLISSSRFLDVMGTSTANSSLDLSKCKNICKILALYPYEPLPDIAFHAPTLPNYPSVDEGNQCDIVEDASLGCHQGALFCTENVESILSYLQISEWLLDCGVTFNYLGAQAVARSPETCLVMMDKELMRLNKESRRVVRHAHSLPAGGCIVRHRGKARFLNRYHKKLSLLLNGGQKSGEGGTCHRNASAEDVSIGSYKHEVLLEVQRPKSWRGNISSLLGRSSSRPAVYES